MSLDAATARHSFLLNFKITTDMLRSFMVQRQFNPGHFYWCSLGCHYKTSFSLTVQPVGALFYTNSKNFLLSFFGKEKVQIKLHLVILVLI